MQDPSRDLLPPPMEAAAKGVAQGAADGAAAVEDKAQAGVAAAQVKSHELDDALPPSMRTAKQIAKRFGANKAGREACLALAKAEPLTPALKKALFRMGREAQLEPGVMVSVIKQSEGVPTPLNLSLCLSLSLSLSVSLFLSLP